MLERIKKELLWLSKIIILLPIAVVVAGFFAILTELGILKRPSMSREDLANRLEKLIINDYDYGDYDDFSCVKVTNKDINELRLKISDIIDNYLDHTENKLCNSEGDKIIMRYIQRLRDGVPLERILD